MFIYGFWLFNDFLKFVIKELVNFMDFFKWIKKELLEVIKLFYNYMVKVRFIFLKCFIIFFGFI